MPEEEIRRQLGFKSGDVFSRSALRDGVRNVTDLYSTIGRASADVIPRTDQRSGTTVDVSLEIGEGPEVYVERINITGNTRSEDSILRREIPFVEGDLFTLQKLQRARQRLVNLGYFDVVNVSTQPGTDKNRILVNVDVTERPTGIFSIGGGFSSVDSFVGTLDISQNNFLGRGWQLSLRIRAGGETQQGIISFTEPWLSRPALGGRLRPVQHQTRVRRVRLRLAGYHAAPEPSVPGVLALAALVPIDQRRHQRRRRHRGPPARRTRRAPG